MKKFIYHTILLLLFSNLSAQSFEKKLDSLIAAKFNKKDTPGIDLLVAKDSTAFHQNTTDNANVEPNTDSRNESDSQIDSTGKEFSAISTSEEQEKLNLNNVISNEISDYPNAKNISLRYLINHLLEIKNCRKTKDLEGASQKEMTPKIMANFFKNESIDSRTRENIEYNSSTKTTTKNF